MTELSADDFIANGGMPPDDFHQLIPRIVEVANHELQVAGDLLDRVRSATSHLLVQDDFLVECVSALLTGNIVLQGPPGTGKSSLARALADAFNVELFPVTAHEDWSTFEVIGRQELRVRNEGTAEEIVPVDGHFTEAVIRCAGSVSTHFDDPGRPQATWLLIDELNRSHPDRAFGELFSVLGSSQPVPIALGYQRPENNSLVVPRRFRIIATINSIDKQFVNALSQGLRRRFTFLTLDIPQKRDEGEPWATGASLAAREFDTVREQARSRVASYLSNPRLETYASSAGFDAQLQRVLELAERVRYADEESDYPYVPIGTAPLVDTAELFLARLSQSDFGQAEADSALDWAVSVKLVPLLDAGTVNREKLSLFGRELPSPFHNETRRGIEQIASDGLFYIR